MDCSINAACGLVQGSAEGPVYRHRCVVPDLPPPEAFLHHPEAAQAAKWFSNFGPLALRLEAALADAYGTTGEVCICASSERKVVLPERSYAHGPEADAILDFAGRSLRAALNAVTRFGVR